MVETFNPNEVDIKLTDSALQHFELYLNAHPEAKALRFAVKKAGCSGYKYVTELLDRISDSDLCIPNDKGLNLVVEQPHLVYLNGMVVDYVTQALGQSKVVFINPNEKNKCGCGESFSA
ncbi:MAG: iron-sulfur cluster assembly accessory family protein [Gammaproteobacteria bacterium]|jgi:iron-sulfur cluster assembly accessory protein|nr:iron-sulfur cluster assembly accessory family protein [Gammaproteobacteria bacterium]